MYSLRFSQTDGKMEMNKLNLKTMVWSSIDVKSHCDANTKFYANFRTAFATGQHSKFWVLHGGKDRGGRYLSDVLAFDFVLQRWSVVDAEGATGVARAHHSLVTVNSGTGEAAELYVTAGRGEKTAKERASGVEEATSPALKDEYFTTAPKPPPATHVTTNSSLINMLKQYCGATNAGYEPVALSDCTIIAHDVEMPAHRIVLAAQSPVFADFFRPGTPEYETGQVEIEGFDVGTGTRAFSRRICMSMSPFACIPTLSHTLFEVTAI